MAKFEKENATAFNPLRRKLIEEAGVYTSPRDLKQETEDHERNLIDSNQTENLQQNREREKSLEIETKNDRLTESMRYRVSRIERREIEKFVDRLSEAADMSLTHSNIMRATRDVLFKAEEKIADELRKVNLKRPINDRRALTIFESNIAEIIHNAIHSTPLPNRISPET